MLEIIYAIQVVLAIMFALWTYDRYAKRWPVTLGDDVVTGSVVDSGGPLHKLSGAPGDISILA